MRKEGVSLPRLGEQVLAEPDWTEAPSEHEMQIMGENSFGSLNAYVPISDPAVACESLVKAAALGQEYLRPQDSAFSCFTYVRGYAKVDDADSIERITKAMKPSDSSKSFLITQYVYLLTPETAEDDLNEGVKAEFVEIAGKDKRALFQTAMRIPFTLWLAYCGAEISKQGETIGNLPILHV